MDLLTAPFLLCLCHCNVQSTVVIYNGTTDSSLSLVCSERWRMKLTVTRQQRWWHRWEWRGCRNRNVIWQHDGPCLIPANGKKNAVKTCLKCTAKVLITFCKSLLFLWMNLFEQRVLPYQLEIVTKRSWCWNGFIIFTFTELKYISKIW